MAARSKLHVVNSDCLLGRGSPTGNEQAGPIVLSSYLGQCAETNKALSIAARYCAFRKTRKATMFLKKKNPPGGVSG